MDSERARRIGENEALFRRVNNAVEEINEVRRIESDEFEIVCECGDQACIEQIPLSRGEYEALRADPTHFAIKPEHEIPPVERVIAKNPRYWIVEKHEGAPARIARELEAREHG
jgi:hypothetical protein